MLFAASTLCVETDRPRTESRGWRELGTRSAVDLGGLRADCYVLLRGGMASEPARQLASY
jgi:hypothetical protein